MVVARTIQELIKARKRLEGSVGFVPTMGALHQGHISLMLKSKMDTDNTIVSIFVNPTQFLVGEDLDKYPRKDIEDLEICEKLGIDIVFMPDISSMYDKDEPKVKAPDCRSYILEGYKRPHHFDGVLQVVLKLFNLTKPNFAYFGRKDAQQVILIKDMVKNFFLDISIVDCDTIREKDGLALSSRNVYLSKEQRTDALKISKSLFLAKEMIENGETSIQKIEQLISNRLDGLSIEYIAIVDRDLNYVTQIKPNFTIILIAVKVGTTRLIDNIWI
jgi:pantoate--beta-alanine ligase